MIWPIGVEMRRNRDAEILLLHICGMDQVDVSRGLGRVHGCGLGTQINYIGCPLTCDNSNLYLLRVAEKTIVVGGTNRKGSTVH